MAVHFVAKLKPGIKEKVIQEEKKHEHILLDASENDSAAAMASTGRWEEIFWVTFMDVAEMAAKKLQQKSTGGFLHI